MIYKIFFRLFTVISCIFTVASPAYAQVPDLVGGPLGVERVASHSTHNDGYHSPKVGEGASAWIQIDLGRSLPVEQVKLFPDVGNNGWYGKANSRVDFPLRFKIETANDADFSDPELYFDHTETDCDGRVAHKIETFTPSGAVPVARYVRLTVTKTGNRRQVFRIWRFEVISGGRDAAEGCDLADSFSGNLGKHNLLRPRRADGELAHFDHPENLSAPESWRPPVLQLRTPRGGITVGGFFGTLLERNEQYLLNGFTVSDMARDFRQRAGKPIPPKRDYLPDNDSPWLRVLGGSNAGRFLMGAGNQLRWRENSELRRRMDELIDAIGECVEPDGYSYGFPERNMLEGGEEGAYARSWFTMGLIEAGIAGNPKAFPMARRANDWFNSCPYLPEMLLHASFGIQGMIPNTRLYLDSPAGSAADIRTVQQYMQMNRWLAQLASRDPSAINAFPYDRPHSYLINPLNAYMDMYCATGDRTYLRAVAGGWDIYHNDFEHTGGSIAICEGGFHPAKSYFLRQHTGELCGSVFWTYLNQQFRLLNPYGEKYAAEMEKSIYNAAAANQCENGDILYHAHLLAPKHSHEENDRNTCCEGQGTRMLGSAPEFIYKIADDGIFVDLFNESSITWEQSGEKWTLAQHTDFPYQPEVKLKVAPSGKQSRALVRVRVPSWATAPVEFFVNGKREATAAPGTYAILDRRWKNRDEISFTLPMGFRLTKYAGMEKGFQGKEAYALEYGPVLMAVVGKSIPKGEINIPYTETELPGKLKPVAGKPLHFTISGADGSLEYIPYFDVKGAMLDSFTCYPFLKTVDNEKND
ncbi:MAG: glycoside hydrolase family 127 protein [Tannerella sp.]|jgi:hypothetical protein|nr:glycoside hydrolase family 127 protein [Tannerella sp.]